MLRGKDGGLAEARPIRLGAVPQLPDPPVLHLAAMGRDAVVEHLRIAWQARRRRPLSRPGPGGAGHGRWYPRGPVDPLLEQRLQGLMGARLAVRQSRREPLVSSVTT